MSDDPWGEQFPTQSTTDALIALARKNMVRRSLGSQIEEALTELNSRMAIKSWAFCQRSDGSMGYVIDGVGPSFSPGEMADWLNERGFDIRIGRA